jgi:hypothetical protein
MAGIFISYRRGDAAGQTGRLHDAVRARFPEEPTFMDVEIPSGTDFVDAIEASVTSCEVFVAVIGERWADARDDQGRRRLDDPDDFVRLELEMALARSDVTVIPVLIDNAALPCGEALPEALRALRRRQATRLRHESWRHDVEVLLEELADLLAHSGRRAKDARTRPRRSPRARRALLGAGAATAAVVAVAALNGNLSSNQDGEVRSLRIREATPLSYGAWRDRNPAGEVDSAQRRVRGVFVRYDLELAGFPEDALLPMRVTLLDLTDRAVETHELDPVTPEGGASCGCSDWVRLSSPSHPHRVELAIYAPAGAQQEPLRTDSWDLPQP